ncbi:uncharacterized protein C8R40DRAFT_1137421 [Lentinula edodes]|uniref:uncharacterized protein n=1 Tax=Lentinula edodes TaxID=5353 RepID=UPI001E8DAF2C|nr:uncharacterized protein C8R40DRAFT_1137421 [Lentinula edodes]KAH7867751.1 hypothetical protein C8R40DRAFT_1137421 [Lentinula edodes]
MMSFTSTHQRAQRAQQRNYLTPTITDDNAIRTVSGYPLRLKLTQTRIPSYVCTPSIPFPLSIYLFICLSILLSNSFTPSGFTPSSGCILPPIEIRSEKFYRRVYTGLPCLGLSRLVSFYGPLCTTFAGSL